MNFKVSCNCREHDFVFAQKPWAKVEMKCPECGELNTFDPAEKPKKVKESDK